MPRLPTARPTVIVGTNLESGTPNTGQFQQTLGGSKTFTSFSGTAGGDALICSGPGRLDAAFMHDCALIALSGQPVIFYDGAAVSGGPITNPVLGVLAPPAITGISGALLRGGVVQNMGFPFLSGLSHSSRSGAPGFSVTYTPTT